MLVDLEFVVDKVAVRKVFLSAVQISLSVSFHRRPHIPINSSLLSTVQNLTN